MTSKLSKKAFGSLVTASLLLCGSSAVAGFVEVNFSADVGDTSVDGQLVLDASAPLAIGAGGVDGVVIDGFMTFGSNTFNVIPDSAFTFAAAGQLNDFGFLGLSGGLAPQGFFALQLASELFFDTENATDALTDELMLGDLLDFGGPGPAESFFFFAPPGQSGDAWALTSFSVVRSTELAEPATVWLAISLCLMVIGVRRVASPI